MASRLEAIAYEEQEATSSKGLRAKKQPISMFGITTRSRGSWHRY